MTTLNAAASIVARKHPVHACSDVTGFGILGHALGMASGSGVTLVIESAKMPLLRGAARLAEKGYITGGCKRNREYLERQNGHRQIDPRRARRSRARSANLRRAAPRRSPNDTPPNCLTSLHARRRHPRGRSRLRHLAAKSLGAFSLIRSIAVRFRRSCSQLLRSSDDLITRVVAITLRAKVTRKLFSDRQ